LKTAIIKNDKIESFHEYRIIDILLGNSYGFEVMPSLHIMSLAALPMMSNAVAPSTKACRHWQSVTRSSPPAVSIGHPSFVHFFMKIMYSCVVKSVDDFVVAPLTAVFVHGFGLACKLARSLRSVHDGRSRIVPAGYSSVAVLYSILVRRPDASNVVVASILASRLAASLKVIRARALIGHALPGLTFCISAEFSGTDLHDERELNLSFDSF
jgi:hypothetical protein